MLSTNFLFVSYVMGYLDFISTCSTTINEKLLYATLVNATGNKPCFMEIDNTMGKYTVEKDENICGNVNVIYCNSRNRFIYNFLAKSSYTKTFSL